MPRFDAKRVALRRLSTLLQPFREKALPARPVGFGRKAARTDRGGAATGPGRVGRAFGLVRTDWVCFTLADAGWGGREGATLLTRVGSREQNMKKTIPIVAVVLIILAVILLGMDQSTNCGRNSAALSYTGKVSSCVRATLMERELDGPAPFASLVPSTSWSEVFRFGWGVKSYWVKKEITSSDSSPIVICAQYFDNVPQPTLWNLYRRNPSFAAGFLLTRSRLLDRTEYNSIDFNQYFFLRKEDISKQVAEVIDDRAPQP